ncbi:hypothetical protein ACFLZP_03740 [Patescibacteria group bacterium]
MSELVVGIAPPSHAPTSKVVLPVLSEENEADQSLDSERRKQLEAVEVKKLVSQKKLSSRQEKVWAEREIGSAAREIVSQYGLADEEELRTIVSQVRVGVYSQLPDQVAPGLRETVNQIYKASVLSPKERQVYELKEQGLLWRSVSQRVGLDSTRKVGYSGYVQKLYNQAKKKVTTSIEGFFLVADLESERGPLGDLRARAEIVEVQKLLQRGDLEFDRVRAWLLKTYGQIPQEIAVKLGYPNEERVFKVIDFVRQAVFLQLPEEVNSRLRPIVAQIHQAANLKEREIEIYRLRKRGKTFREISVQLGYRVSRRGGNSNSRVNSHYYSARDKLATSIKGRFLIEDFQSSEGRLVQERLVAEERQIQTFLQGRRIKDFARARCFLFAIRGKHQEAIREHGLRGIADLRDLVSGVRLLIYSQLPEQAEPGLQPVIESVHQQASLTREERIIWELRGQKVKMAEIMERAGIRSHSYYPIYSARAKEKIEQAIFKLGLLEL